MNILQVLTHRIGSLIGIKNEHLTSFDRQEQLFYFGIKNEHLTSFDKQDRFFNWNKERTSFKF